MIIDIALHLRQEDIHDTIIKSRITDDGDRYWIIKLVDKASIFIDNDADLRMLSVKIAEALEHGGQKSESATSQCTPGPTDTVSGEGSAGST